MPLEISYLETLAVGYYGAVMVVSREIPIIGYLRSLLNAVDRCHDTHTHI